MTFSSLALVKFGAHNTYELSKPSMASNSYPCIKLNRIFLNVEMAGPFAQGISHAIYDAIFVTILVRYENLSGKTNDVCCDFSGTPLRPKAAKVEPHTHTKRHAGNFLWSWQAEWPAGTCAVCSYVRRIS